MKKILFLIGGFCAAATGFLVLERRRIRLVEEAASTREASWTDYQNVA